MSMLLRAILPFVILVLGGAGFWALNVSAPVAVKAPHLERVPVVNTQLIQPSTMTIPVYARGIISADTQLMLLAEYGGQIVEVSPAMRSGSRIKRGQLLVRFDDSAIRHDITRVSAHLETVRQRYEAVRLEIAAEQMVRGLSSPQKFLEQKLNEAGSQVKAAEAELALAKLQLDKAQLTAPFDAEIQESFVVVGQRVAPGFRVASLYDDAPRQVQLPLSDRQLRMVATEAIGPDQKTAPRVMLRLRYGEQYHYWRGHLVSMQNSIDPRNRLTYVVAEIGAPVAPTGAAQQPELRVGQLLEAEIQGRLYPDVVALPRDVLHENDQIWLVDEHNKLRQQTVRILYKGKGQVYIHAGLQAGDRVVTSAVDIGLEGMRVVPSEEPKGAPQPSVVSSLDTPIARRENRSRQSNQP